jgi:Ring finger domain
MRTGLAELGETLPVITTPVNTACGICLEEPIQQQVVLKACKHAFCFACLKDWQARSVNTALSAAENSAMSCPYCRQDIKKSVVEDAMDNAVLYTARAGKLQENDPDRKKYFELALAELDKILVTDERDLGALRLKGHILLRWAPADAIQVYLRMLALDQEGSANLEKLEAMADEMKVTMDAGDGDEALRLLGQVQAYQSSGAFFGRIGSGPRRLFSDFVNLAEAHEAAGNWAEARPIYVALSQEAFMGDLTTYDSRQNWKMLMGHSRCSYQLGMYDRALYEGETAMAMSRSLPGVHKLVAMPQLALGQLEAARTTMRRSILHEAPWNDENRQENFAFLEECLRDETTKEEGAVATASDNAAVL